MMIVRAMPLKVIFGVYKQPNVLCYFSSCRKWHFLATELLGGHLVL